MDDTRTTRSLAELIEAVTPVHLFLGLGVTSLIVMVVGTCSMFSIDGPLPPPRPAPPRIEKSAVDSYRFKEGYFKALVTEDAQKLKLKTFSFKKLAAPNRHYVEFTGSQTLKPGGKLETRHLELTALKKQIWVGEQGQGFRSAHLVLVIHNRTDRYLAYRVQSEVRGQCGGKGSMPHNSIALRPGGTVMRTECLLRSGGVLRVLEVEVMEISALGYYYISRLDPQQIRLSVRTSDGHELPGGLQPCRILPWRAIQAGMRRGDVRWRDVIDFYSRHNCDEYSFFVEYGFDRKGPGRLPALPPGVKG